MSLKKTIQINPIFLKVNRSKKNEKKRKPEWNSTLKPNNIKNKYITKNQRTPT